ncbi:hypothetical protein Q1695_007135 [Nippostrongylus brasiliensis]|nr:hypothetical protein Q1695_007135 [Nippostrongylus brasiliensis]
MGYVRLPYLSTGANGHFIHLFPVNMELLFMPSIIAELRTAQHLNGCANPNDPGDVRQRFLVGGCPDSVPCWWCRSESSVSTDGRLVVVVDFIYKAATPPYTESSDPITRSLHANTDHIKTHVDNDDLMARWNAD